MTHVTKNSFTNKANAVTTQIISDIHDPIFNINETNISGGILINYYDSIHVITNFSTTRHNTKSYVHLNNYDEKVNTEIINQSFELGLSLLKLNDVTNWKHEKDVYELSQIIPEHMNDDFPIKIYAINFPEKKNLYKK